jgi:hypothetical protein
MRWDSCQYSDIQAGRPLSQYLIPGSDKKCYMSPQRPEQFGTFPTSYTMGTMSLSPGVKQQECEADFTSSPSAMVKDGVAILHFSSFHSI